MRRIIVFALLISAFFTACDDVSVSKKDLLTKSWILEETILNGEFYDYETIYLKNSIFTFMDDATVQIVISQSSDIHNGTWQFLNNNTELTIAFSGVMYEYVISKASKKLLTISSHSDKLVIKESLLTV